MSTAPKLKWRVAPAPTGRYKSFHPRSWPIGLWPDDKPAAQFACADDYTPGRARGEQPHGPLRVGIAEYHAPSSEAAKSRGAFTWMFLKRQAATLDEAKQLAQQALAERPHWWPQDVKNNLPR